MRKHISYPALHFKNPNNSNIQIPASRSMPLHGELLHDDGTREWWRDGVRHREDGPAIEWADGDKEWWVKGELHREDGPAVERADGSTAWFRRGRLWCTEAGARGRQRNS